jgi:hypothetical protein
MSIGTALLAVVFGQHVHLILMPVIFFYCCCLKDKFDNSNLRTEEVKENIRREIVNIPAEQLQRVNQNSCEECLRVEERHFQYLLCLVNKVRTSLHSESYRLLCMLIQRKIRMGIAASDAPAAVKGRAVEPDNKVKIRPVNNYLYCFLY